MKWLVGGPKRQRRRVPSAGAGRRRRLHLHGFGLMEVIISGSMMLVGIAGMFSAYSTLTDAYAHQRYMTEGIHIAESELEAMLVRFADDPLLAVDTHEGIARYTRDGQKTTGAGFFTVDVTVETHPVVAGFRRVTVTVRWPERGREAQVQLTTERT